MINNIELNKEVKLVLLKKCYAKVLARRFYGKENEPASFIIPKIGKITLTSKQIIDLANIYLDKYAKDEVKKQYNDYIEELKNNYDIYNLIKENPSIKNKIKIEGNDYKQVATMAKKYCFYVLKMSEEEVEEKFGKKGQYVTVMKTLLKLDNKKDIIEYLDEVCNKDLTAITALRTNINNYKIVHCRSLKEEEKNSVEETLKEKINIYSSYASQIKREEKQKEHIEEKEKQDLEELPNAKRIIEEIIEWKFTINEYLRRNNLDFIEFYNYMKILEKYDKETYERLKSKEKMQSEKYFIKHNQLLCELLYKLKNGVETGENKNRTFDILDYYFTYNVPLIELKKSIEYEKSNIAKEDYLMLRTFISTHMNDKELDIDSTINTKIEINSERDNRGFPIQGTGRVITREEKENIIFYLKDNDIPLTNATYRIALKKYTDVIIKKEKNKVKTLKK